MKISDHIKSSLDAADARELDKAMLFACLAVDGTAKKLYPEIDKVNVRFKKFIIDHLDIIELMFGGVDLHNTLFPLKSNKGECGLKFEDIVYEKYRCNLAHGNELPGGYALTLKVSENVHRFMIDIEDQSMTFPESVIFALGLTCVLSPVNADQKIGSNLYRYNDSINQFVVDRWWGKIDCARSIMDFESQVKVKIDFSEVWPSS